MTQKPHIILFNPDQFRSDALAHLGCSGAVTPNLDQTCQTDGRSFAQAYVQNPVCTPSRCSFMSGWYPHVHGHRTMYHMLQANEPMLLRLLKEQGYFVWWGGKNDVMPGEEGYESACHVYNRTRRQITGYNLHKDTAWRGQPDGDNYYSFYAGQLTAKVPGPYVDGDWAQVLDAIDLINTYTGDKPLCIYLPLSYPHPPYGVEEPYYSQIDRRLVRQPVKPYADWSDKPSVLEGLWQSQQMQNWSDERLLELKATYLGMCARVDAQYGLILQALQGSGRYDDSAVFFFSDHGDFTGDYGLVEKTQNTFQDCLTRVPLLIKPPRALSARGGISEALVELVDLPATVADLAGIELGYSQFGRSLVGLITGQAHEHRDAVFCEGGRLRHEGHCAEGRSLEIAGPDSLYMPRIRLQMKDGPEHGKAVMLRTRTHKYVYRLYETHELYNLTQDPDETVNRIHDSSQQAVLQTLKERMLRFFLETGDVVPWPPNERSF
jgi:arylsulfatase A-like enzyme